jgi:hypothetical protein
MMQYLNEAGSAAAAQPDSSRPAHYMTGVTPAAGAMKWAGCASRSPVGHRLYAESEDAGCMVGSRQRSSLR